MWCCFLSPTTGYYSVVFGSSIGSINSAHLCYVPAPLRCTKYDSPYDVCLFRLSNATMCATTRAICVSIWPQTLCGISFPRKFLYQILIVLSYFYFWNYNKCIFQLSHLLLLFVCLFRLSMSICWMPPCVLPRVPSVSYWRTIRQKRVWSFRRPRPYMPPGNTWLNKTVIISCYTLLAHA